MARRCAVSSWQLHKHDPNALPTSLLTVAADTPFLSVFQFSHAPPVLTVPSPSSAVQGNPHDSSPRPAPGGPRRPSQGSGRTCLPAQGALRRRRAHSSALPVRPRERGPSETLSASLGTWPVPVRPHTHGCDFSACLCRTDGLIRARTADSVPSGRQRPTGLGGRLRALPRPPHGAEGRGLRLRSGGLLRLGTRLRRAPAGGVVVTQLDAPRVTVPRSPGRAALAARPAPSGQGGAVVPPGPGGWNGVGRGRRFSASPSRRAPLAPPQRLVASTRKLLLVGEAASGRNRGQVKGGSFLANMVV